MKILYIIALFCVVSNISAEKDGSKFGVNIKNSYNIHNQVINRTHVIVTIVKTQTCVATINLHEDSSFEHVNRMIELQKSKCATDETSKKKKKGNPKLNIDL